MPDQLTSDPQAAGVAGVAEQLVIANRALEHLGERLVYSLIAVEALQDIIRLPVSADGSDPSSEARAIAETALRCMNACREAMHDRYGY